MLFFSILKIDDGVLGSLLLDIVPGDIQILQLSISSENLE